ncbi:MAG: hypothetical protein ABFE08_21195 [Armatimonadia bacterium]
MPGVTSRAAVAFSLVLSLSLIALLIAPHAGFGWGQSQLARQALLDALQPLQAQPAAAPVPAFAGRSATSDEALALDATLKAYLEALRGRQFDQAWSHATSQNWTFGTWRERLPVPNDPSVGSAGDFLLSAFVKGNRVELGEVITSGSDGLARLIITLAPRQSYLLVRRDGRWLIDLDSTEQLLAETESGRQVEQVAGNIGQLYFTMMPDRGMRLDQGIAALLVMVPDLVRYEVSTRRVSADRAMVTAQAEAKVNLAVALERTVSGWHLNRRVNPEVIRPETPLRDANIFTGMEGPKTKRCLANLRQLSQAMRLYMADYDQRLPAANRWCTDLSDYVTDPGFYSCPAVTDKYGYAMNYKLSLLPLGKVTQPWTTAELFDSTLLRPNAYDLHAEPGASVPSPGRHDRLISYAFVDGHVAPQSYRLAQGFYRPIRALPRESLATIPAVRMPGGG